MKQHLREIIVMIGELSRELRNPVIAAQAKDLLTRIESAPAKFNQVLFCVTLRKHIGDTPLREVSAAAGVSTSTVSRIQNGGLPDIETFAALCIWMGIHPGTFFSEPQP